MSGHLDEAWRLVQAAFRTHDVELAEDSARAISEQVAGELITRGHVLPWDAHARAVEAHTDAAVQALRDEVELHRRREAIRSVVDGSSLTIMQELEATR